MKNKEYCIRCENNNKCENCKYVCCNCPMGCCTYIKNQWHNATEPYKNDKAQKYRTIGPLPKV